MRRLKGLLHNLHSFQLLKKNRCKFDKIIKSNIIFNKHSNSQQIHLYSSHYVKLLQWSWLLTIELLKPYTDIEYFTFIIIEGYEIFAIIIIIKALTLLLKYVLKGDICRR